MDVASLSRFGKGDQLYLQHHSILLLPSLSSWLTIPAISPRLAPDHPGSMPVLMLIFFLVSFFNQKLESSFTQNWSETTSAEAQA